MAEKLKFRIVNSTVGEHSVEFEHEGETATKKVRTLHVDLEPIQEGGKTFGFDLPADKADAYPEGAEVTMSLSVKAPDTTETEA